MRNPFLPDAPMTAAASRNPFLDSAPAPSSGVTIAPKGGTPYQMPVAPQRNYAAAEIPGAIAENFVPDAKRVAGEVYDAFRNRPVETVKTMGKTIVGMAQELVPGQQQYETEYADPFYLKLFSDYGLTWDKEGNPTFDKEQFKRTISERPVQTALDASLVAAPVESLPGRVGRIAGRASRVVNPAYVAGKGVTTVAKRAVTPFPALSEEVSNATRVLKSEGVTPTAGQATGRKSLQYAEGELGGAKTADVLDQQQKDYTRAALKRVGEDADVASPEVLDRAHKRIGGEFDRIAAGNQIIPDAQLASDVTAAVDNYTNLTGAGTRAPVIENIANQIRARSAAGPIFGKWYQSTTSRLARLARKTADPELKAGLLELREALDSAFERSLTAAGKGDDVAALRVARTQYRNLLAIDDAMASSTEAAARGAVTPERLSQASVRQGTKAHVTGKGDFSDLARAGNAVLKSLPQSGTAPRAAVRMIPTLIGAALGGGGMESMLGALIGAGTPAAIGRVLMSKPVQTYLRNQLLAGNSRAGRVARNALLPTVSATPRVNALTP